MDNNNIWVIGASGSMGSKHLAKLEKRTDGVKAWGWDIANKGGASSYKDLIHTKINNFIVVTPSNTHYEIAKYYIERGKNLLIEKPISLNYKEAQTLYRLSREYNTVLMTGHNYGFNPDFRRALPELYHAKTLVFDMHLPHDNIVENVVFDLGIHQFELAFKLGQREFDRDFKLKEVRIKPGTQNVYVHAQIGSKNCHFNMSYRGGNDHRTLHYDHTGEVDFHDADGKSPDAMSNLHDAFIKACEVGIWQSHYAENAVAAVQLAEMVQNKLFR